MIKSIKNQLILIGIVATTSSFAPVSKLINNDYTNQIESTYRQGKEKERKLKQKLESLKTTINEKTQLGTKEELLTKSASDTEKTLKKESLEKEIQQLQNERTLLKKELQQLYKEQVTQILKASKQNKQKIINQLNSYELGEEIKQMEVATVFHWTKNGEHIITYIDNILTQIRHSDHYISVTTLRYLDIDPSEVDLTTLNELQAESKEYESLKEQANQKKTIVISYIKEMASKSIN